MLKFLSFSLFYFIYYLIDNNIFSPILKIIGVDDRVSTNGVRDREWGGSGGQIAGPQGSGGQVIDLKLPSNLLIF